MPRGHFTLASQPNRLRLLGGRDHWQVEVLGRRASDLARALGQTRGNLSTTAQAARWQAEIPIWCR